MKESPGMHFRAKFFQQNFLSITGLSFIGILPLGQVAAQRCPGLEFFSGYWNIFLYFISFPARVVKRILLSVHSWLCPCQGPNPGTGWTPPRCPGGSGNSPDCYLYHFQQVLLKEFCSNMHSWACPCRGPNPGAGWTPPRCPGGSGNSPDYY